MQSKQYALLATIATLAFASVVPIVAAAGTLDRIRQSGHIKLGYLSEARPFSFGTGSSAPDGYSIALCNQVVAEVKKQLGTNQLVVDWLSVPAASRVGELKNGEIDLLCAPMSVTLGRREDVSFSIPIFPSGMRAVIRTDAAQALHAALAATPDPKVVWRGSPAAKLLSGATVAAVKGTPSETWLASRISSLELNAKVTNVLDYHAGLQQLRDRKIDIFFGDRTLVLGAMDNSMKGEFVVLDRLFTQEPAALALTRGDEEFRLVVDRALGKLYTSTEFRALYLKWFGEFNDSTRNFFVWNSIEP